MLFWAFLLLAADISAEPFRNPTGPASAVPPFVPRNSIVPLTVGPFSNTLAGDHLGDGDWSGADAIALQDTDTAKVETESAGKRGFLNGRAAIQLSQEDRTLRIVGLPSRQPSGAWRITWNSVSGRSYKLQHVAGDALGATNHWIDRTTVNATGSTAFADDTGGSGSSTRFYRVALIEEEFTPTMFLPVPLATGGWRLSWTSVAGNLYKLQRIESEDLRASPLQWLEISALTATSSTTSTEDLSVSANGRRFYRVAQFDAPTRSGPTLSLIHADPGSRTSEGMVELSITATDSTDVVQVSFFGGQTVIGSATRSEADTWRLFWPVGAGQSGTNRVTARAINLAGVATTSSPLAYTVTIQGAQRQETLGLVTLRADQFVTNGPAIVANGNIRVGVVLLSSNGTVSIDTAQGSLTGRGKVIVPGFGEIFEGAFAVDPASGWLNRAEAAQFASIKSSQVISALHLNSRVTLTAREIEVNVLSRAFRGSGEIEMQTTDQKLGTLRCDGAFYLDPTAFALTVHGAFTLGNLSGSGTITIRLHDSTFVMSGAVATSKPGGGTDSLTHATFELSIKPGSAPQFAIAGVRTVNNVAQDVAGVIGVDGTVILHPDERTPTLIRSDSARFVPLGADGQPLNGVAVRARADDSLPPLEYRPSGASLLGAGQHFFMRFPAGARLVETGNESFFEFIQVTAGFGPASPFQLVSPLQRVSGIPKRLRLGALDFADLMAVFDLEPANGLAVRVLDRLPLVWKGGSIVTDGIRGGKFGLETTGMPVPGTAGDFPDFTIDLTRRDGVLIPLTGEFELPDGSGTPGKLSVPKNRPIWLGVRADGQLFLSGRVAVEFPGGGPKFSADFQLDDPFYDLSVTAKGLELPLLGRLADLLPGPGLACIPGNGAPDINQLRQAVDCLKKHDLAYLNFSASAVAVGVGDGPSADGGLAAPPDPFSTLTSVLDAYSYTALAGGSGNLPQDLLKSLFKQTGDRAVATRGLETILACRLALERARKAGLRDGNPDEFDAAVSACLGAAIDRADGNEAVLGLGNFKAALVTLLQTEVIVQNLGTDNSDQAQISNVSLRDAMNQLVQRFLGNFTTSHGVTPNVFTPDRNVTINTMNRFVAHDTLAQLCDVLVCARKLGIDRNLTAPVRETKTQLALRLNTELARALLGAEADADYRAFTGAVQDTLDLVGYRRTAVLDDLPAQYLNLLPGDSFLQRLPARLEQVLRNDNTLTGGDYLPGSMAAEVRRLLNILQQVPASASHLAPLFQLAHERMEAALTRSITALTTNTDLFYLVDLLQAGMLHAQLHDLFGYNASAPWESNDRLGKIVDRIAAIGVQQNGWSALNRAVTQLLDEAIRQSRDASPPLARSMLYLEQAAKLLTTSRTVAVTLWTNERDRRGGVLDVADIVLPGDIRIDKVAGSVHYHRHTRELGGAFSGQMRLPKFDLSLAIANASFSTGGGFDLNAYGSIVLPTAANPAGRISITPEHPLHIRFRAPNDLRFSGGAKFEINGLTFEGFIGIEDPEYTFGLSAQGIRFDLANSMKVFIPTLPNNTVFDAATARDLGDYFRSMNATMEGLRSFDPARGGAGASRASLQAGFSPSFDPPDFLPGFNSSPLDAVEAWANGIVADTRLGIVRDYSATIGHVSSQLDQLASAIRNTPPERLSPVQLLVRVKLMQRLCEAHKSLKNNPNRAAYQELEGSGRLNGFIAGTQEHVKRLLESEDPRLAAHLVEIVSATGEFITQWGCFRNESDMKEFELLKDSIVQAFTGFLVRQEPNLFSQLGLDPATGEKVPGSDKFDQLQRDQIKGVFSVFLEFMKYQQALEIESRASYPVALRNLGARWRELLYRRILQLAPPEYPDLVKKLDRLRFLRPDPVRCCGAPEVPELLAVYEELRELRKELFNLLSIAQLSFEWPEGPIYQPYGPAAPYDDGVELANASHAWNHAVLFADNLTQDGKPLNDSKVRKVFLLEYIDKRDTNGVLRNQLVTIRLDHIKLHGNDYDPRFALTKRAREEVARNAALKNSELGAARNALDIAENRLIVNRSIERQAPATELLDELLGLAAYFQENRLPNGQPSPELGRVKFAIRGLIDRVIGSARGGAQSPRLLASDRAAPSWFHLNEFTRRLADAAQAEAFVDAPELRQDFLTQASELIRAAAGVADQLQRLLPTQRPVDLHLPGALVIDRVFGEMTYRRDTGLLGGRFGGRLEFPDNNAYFDVNESTVNNQGSFGFKAGLGSPLPMGGVRLMADLTVSGRGRPNLDPRQPPIPGDQEISLTGTGKLFLPRNGARTQEYDVRVAYDTTNQVLSFDTLASNLDIELGRHVVLFGAGFGFKLGGIGPDGLRVRQGELSFEGSAGFSASPSQRSAAGAWTTRWSPRTAWS